MNTVRTSAKTALVSCELRVARKDRLATRNSQQLPKAHPAPLVPGCLGVVHGGFAMALLDSAMGCSVHSTLGVGDRYTTLELKTNFVRPITLDTGIVRCEGVVIHRGGTIATAEGKVTAVNTGKLLAHGTTTCLIIPTRSA